MAGALRQAGLKIEIHDDHFAPDAKDEEWLTVAGQKQWIVVTRDERIRYRVAAKQAIRRARVRAFVLTAQGDLRSEILADNFVKALSKVRRTVQEEKPPFLAKISRSGEVTVLKF
jgi:PIN like domain